MSRTPQDIIHGQLLKWEKSQPPSDQQEHIARQPRPMISVSSAYGSHGWEIGRQVAELLGFDFFDRELVERIATTANVRERVAESLDQRVQAWITEHLAQQFDNYHFTQSDFLRHLASAILTIAQHGEAVIVGRGSQFILNPQHALRVRTIAPLDYRIATIATEEKLSTGEARAAALRRDAERLAFYRLHFNIDVTEPNHYDLVLNTSLLSCEQYADIIVYAFLARFGQHARVR